MNNITPDVELLTPPADDGQVRDWLEKYSSSELPYLLAFAEDGVIWGKWKDGLKLADEVFAGNTTQLRGETLQQSYLFGKNSQIHLFRNGSSWKATKVTDAKNQDEKDKFVLTEFQVLWGDTVVKSSPVFTHIRDKQQQGLDMVVPVVVTDADFDSEKVVRLEVRHYITQTETGEARIYLSRLVRIGVGPVAEEKIL